MFWSHPKLITFLWYASQKGYLPLLSHPRDFNEQLLAINLLALHDEKARKLRVRCTDKYLVREFVQEKGFEDILNTCYGVYESFDEIDFYSLPDKVVLKSTTGCGQNVFCCNKSELRLESIREKFTKWASDASTFGLKTAEWHYSYIKPRIIAEKYLESPEGSISLIDYKFHCVKGKIAGILVCYDRNNDTHMGNFDLYDTEWNLTEGILPQYHKRQRVIPRPVSLERMMEIAKSLSSGIDYVRVDFYEIEGKPIFGEMTFTPAGNVMTKYQTWVMKDMLRLYNE